MARGRFGQATSHVHRRPCGAVPRLQIDPLRRPYRRGRLVAPRHRDVGRAGERRRIIVEHEEPHLVDPARRAEVDLDRRGAVFGFRARPTVGRRPQIPGDAVGEHAGRRALGDRTHREPRVEGAVVVDGHVDSRRCEAGPQAVVDEAAGDHAIERAADDRGEVRFEGADLWSRGDDRAVRHEEQPLAEPVPRARAIPDHCHLAAAVGDVVEGAVIPVVGNERPHLEDVVVSRHEAHQPRDDEIGVARVEIVLAVVEGVVPLEAAGVGIAGLGEIRAAVLAVGAGVDAEETEIVGLRDERLLAPLQHGGEGLERLRGRIRPTLAAPPAAMLLQQEHRVVALQRRGAEVGEEEVRIHEELPGPFVALAARGHVELPRDVADQLAAGVAAGEAARLVDLRVGLHGMAVGGLVIAEGNEEESTPVVPEHLLHPIAEPVSLGAMLRGAGGIAGELVDVGEAVEVGPLIGVEARAVARSAPQDVFRLAAGDVELHAVVMADLPEELLRRHIVRLPPAFGVGFEPRDQIGREHVPRRTASGRIEPWGRGMHQMHGPDAVREPRAVVAGLGPLRIEPIAGVVAGDPGLPQPAGLIELMPGGAADRAVGARPSRPVEKLGKHVARVGRAVGEMLRDQFPAVVPGRLDVGIGALEGGDVIGEPIEIPVVPERLPLDERARVEHVGSRDATGDRKGDRGQRFHDAWAGAKER